MKKLILSFCIAITFCLDATAQSNQDKVASAVEFLKQAMVSGNQNKFRKNNL